VTISAGLSGDRWVRQVRIAPGDRRLVRAAFASIVSAAPRGDAGAGGREPVWVGAWTPWQPVISPPEDGAFLLPAGSRIEVELHYRGADAPAVDRSTVHITFAEARRRTPGATLAIHAVHRAAPGRWRGARTLPRAATIWALRPEGVEGRSLEVTAYSTDGRVQVLLWIPRFRADWPAPFVLAKPVTLDAGTVVRVIAEGPRPTAGALLAIAE
jgi:hypothetical protein